jgi:transcription elongation factor GreA
MTMTDRVPMTPRGQQMLREELKKLKEQERPAVVRAIEEARAHGDLSENAEYHAAKERQSFIEGRIQDVEAKLGRAEVIDPSRLDGSRVVFGATVLLADASSGEEVSYTLVGEDEANVKAGQISIRSPLARALIGREPGDSVRLQTGKGQREYEILDVKFGP